MDEAVVVFTAKSAERILSEGGSSAWRLAPWRARTCAYAVCTRNTHSSWGDGKEEHRSAFLVGRLRNVVPVERTPENKNVGEERYLLEFSEFARVDIPNVWQMDRNPVRYSTLSKLGIDPASLDWQPMPERARMDAPVEPVPAVVGALSLAEAKRGLALTFNVPPEAIEITIRG